MMPLLFLAVMILLPLCAMAVHRVRGRSICDLAELAGQWQAHFATDDRFKLAPRIASQIPCPGAADIRVYNVIYAKSDDRYHFIFTIDWTSGVLRWKKHTTRVAAVMDEKPSEDLNRDLKLRLADDSLPYIKQYEQLRENCCHQD